MQIRYIFILLSTIFTIFCSGCSDKENTEIRSIRDLNNPQYIIGGMTGIIATMEAQKKLPNAQFREYAMPADALLALDSNKITAVVLDRPTLEYMAMEHPGLCVLPEDLAIGHISVAGSLKNPELMRKVNEFIRTYRADGTYRKMFNRWFHTKDPDMPEIRKPEKPAGKLVVGITGDNVPMCYIKNGKLAGFDSEFAIRLAAFLNKEIIFKNMVYDALIPALAGTKIDLAIAQVDAMPERMSSVIFSEEYIDSPITFILQKKNYAYSKKEIDPAGSLIASFQKTFIRENRWQLILQGLSVTILITFFSVVFGTVLAFPVCMMCRSRNRLLVWLAKRYISLIQGTPVLVLLMILYYVVFAKVNISAILVAILAFSLDFAAYTSVTLRSGIDGIPKGQMEAALALGFKPLRAFFYFILPQAVRIVLPVYRGEIIATLKSTSIVGYIAIMDLTKMSDIIRSRTYDAFFPLVATAVIYFLAAKCLTSLLIILEKKLDPEQHRNELKAAQRTPIASE